LNVQLILFFSIFRGKNIILSYCNYLNYENVGEGAALMVPPAGNGSGKAPKTCFGSGSSKVRVFS
jgi:hypothetical protein